MRLIFSYLVGEGAVLIRPESLVELRDVFALKKKTFKFWKMYRIGEHRHFCFNKNKILYIKAKFKL